jgi:hypothetical protein
MASDKSNDLPPMLPSMWRLCKLGYRYEPGLMGVAFALALLMALPDALLALWFKWLGEAVLQRDAGLMRTAAFALGLSATATWLLGVLSSRMQRRFRDLLVLEFESQSPDANIPKNFKIHPDEESIIADEPIVKKPNNAAAPTGAVDLPSTANGGR